MSGHKRKFITISEDEYQRLHESEMLARGVSQTAQIRIDGIARESQAALWEALRETRARQEHFNDTVARLGQDMLDVEAKTGQLLMAYHERLAGTVQTSLSNLQARLDEQLSEQALYYEQQAALLRRDTFATAQALASFIEDSASDQERKLAVASSWLQTAAELVDLIRGEYYLDEESAARLDMLDAELDAAETNLAEGFYETCLSSAQAAVTSASALRMELERKIYEHEVLRLAALSRVRQISVLAEDRQYIQAVSLDGKPVPFEINVDYWSGGRLSQLQDFIGRLELRLEHTPESFTRPGLDTLLDYTLPELQERLEEIVRQARWNALNSQLRINIADLAIQALESQGFELTESGYSQEDARLGYSALAKDYAGNEVRISVEPVEGAVVQNELHIESGDAEQLTEHELVRRDLEISRALEELGLEVMGLRIQEPVTARPVEPAPRVPLPQADQRKGTQQV